MEEKEKKVNKQAKAEAPERPAAAAVGGKEKEKAPAPAAEPAAVAPAAVAAPAAPAAPVAPASTSTADIPRMTGKAVRPDGRFNSLLIGKFVNCLMKQGKKSTAERIFYHSMEVLAKKYPNVPPVQIFETALNNVKPLVEVKSKRVGGATYQVPFEVNRKRQQSLAIRWVLEGARKRKGKSMQDKLALELVDAYNKTGAAWTMRENTHKMAEANKAFAHFAW